MKLPKLFLLACAVLVLSLSATAQTDTTITTDSISHSGLVREYRLYIPTNIAPNAPLLFVLHGYGGTNQLDRIGFNAIAQREGFVVCYPLGSVDSRNKPCWNVGYPSQETMTVDDVDFMKTLANHLQKQYSLDPKRTFCTGMSNGGEMCYLLAFEASDTFAAVGSVAGLTMQWMYDNLKVERPMPLLEIHGTEDRTSEWYGDTENKGGWGKYIPVPIAVGYWVAANKCRNMTQEQIPSLKSDNGRSVVFHRYYNGTGGNEVWLYEIRGGAHSWGMDDIATAEVVWNFLSRFELNQPNSVQTSVPKTTE